MNKQAFLQEQQLQIELPKVKVVKDKDVFLHSEND